MNIGRKLIENRQNKSVKISVENHSFLMFNLINEKVFFRKNFLFVLYFFIHF
jgi:hypothetical protein